MMPSVPTIRATEILRHYKRVFDQVIATNEPVIITTQDGMKVALISVKDLETLRRSRYKESAKTLLSLAQTVRNLTKAEKLPPDLSVRHDTYLWEP